MPEVSQNLQRVREAIERASKRSGRDPSGIVIVAVTKNVPLDLTQEALKSGVTDIGENRAQEMAEKFPLLHGVTKHFIGHLQTNKVKTVVALCDWIQSVDSVQLLEKIGRESEKQAKMANILLQINFFPESAHHGFSPGEVYNAFETALKTKSLSVHGLMTVPPPDLPEAEIRETFASLRKLRDELEVKLPVKLPVLSMGMTDDFEIAVEEGATTVRIGRGIFGERGVGN